MALSAAMAGMAAAWHQRNENGGSNSHVSKQQWRVAIMYQ